MEWLHKMVLDLKSICLKIMKIGKNAVGANTKSPRPIVKKVFIPAIIDEEATIEEKYIIVNSKGETLDAPIFDGPIDAEAWLEDRYPKAEYVM